MLPSMQVHRHEQTHIVHYQTVDSWGRRQWRSPEICTIVATRSYSLHDGPPETAAGAVRRVSRPSDRCDDLDPRSTCSVLTPFPELTTLVSARQKLESQQQENKSVQKVCQFPRSTVRYHANAPCRSSPVWRMMRISTSSSDRCYSSRR